MRGRGNRGPISGDSADKLPIVHNYRGLFNSPPPSLGFLALEHHFSSVRRHNYLSRKLFLMFAG